jgi:predicted secreted protein
MGNKSNAFSGVGTTFGRAETTGTSDPTFVNIAEINSLDGPNKTRSTIDVTSIDSDEGYREFIASFRDAGEVVLGMNFTAAGYEGMNDDFESDESREYRITLPNTEGTVFEFDCYVTALGMSVPLDDKVTASATLKITGPVRTTS